MGKVTTIGLDLAKNVFQIHGEDREGRVVLRKRLSRAKLLPFFANLSSCLVGIEACGGSNFWARKISELGHDVRQISPRDVKRFLVTNKNDYNDAEAICEAATSKTALANQARGFLFEYGIIFPKGLSKIRNSLPQILENEENELTLVARDYLSDIYEQLISLDEKISKYDRRLKTIVTQSPPCKKICKIPGIGPQTATAVIAAIGNASEFKNGRHLAAWLGLVPRQNSSGDRVLLLGISKRGNVYLRKLLIHGARAVIRHCRLKGDRISLWLQQLIERRGKNKAAVALANKNARIIWALLSRDLEYKVS